MAIANWTCVSWVACAPGPSRYMLHGSREFNACQTPRSMYTPTFNRLRAIARYWSEIATFSYPMTDDYLHLTPPLGVFPFEFREKVWSSENWIMGLPVSENSLMIGWAVSTQYQRVTYRQPDVQPTSRTCAVWLTHVKNGPPLCVIWKMDTVKSETILIRQYSRNSQVCRT